MATFSQDPQKTNDPSYLNSQGTERASLQPIPQAFSTQTMTPPNANPDTTYGKLFEGVGDVLNTAVKGTDEAIKGHVRDDLYAQLDKIRDQFGVAKAQADPTQGKILGGASAEGTPLPLAVKKLGNRIDGLQEAYKSGALSDSYYWSKMEAEVRQIRAQYPGYRDYVDQEVAKVLGTTPANALRRSLLQDVTELAKKNQSLLDKWTTFEHTNLGEIQQALPDYYQRKAAGNPYSQIETEYAVAQVKADKEVTATGRAKLALDADKKKYVGDNGERALAGEYDSLITSTLDQAMKSQGAGSMSTLMAKTKNGQPLTPQEQEQFNTQYRQVELALRNGMEQIQSQKLAPNNPNSPTYRTLINDPNKIQQIADNAMGRLKSIKDSVFNGEYGSVGMNASFNNSLKNLDMKAALTQDDTLRKWQVIQSVAPKAIEVLLSDPTSKLLGDTAQTVRGMNLGNLLGGNEKDMSGAVKRAKENGVEKDSAYWNATINDFTSAIKTPDMPDDKKANAANALFNRKYNFLLKFEPDKQTDYFQRFSSPAVRDSMLKLRDKGETDTWNNYRSWAEDSAIVLSKQAADTLQEGIGGKSVKLEFDPKTMQLEFKDPYPNEGDTMNYGGARMSKSAVLDTEQGPYRKALADVNKALSVVGGIYKAEGRTAPEKSVQKLLKTTLDLTPAESPGKTFTQSVNDAITEAFMGKVKPDEYANPPGRRP